MTKEKSYNSIPKTVELFGRIIKTLDETGNLDPRYFGEARYGSNQIAFSKKVVGNSVSEEELKITYLHEMLHFILNFTGFESLINEGKQIDIEQFIELLASGIYQYEKTAKY
jgi:hypothetical protein